MIEKANNMEVKKANRNRIFRYLYLHDSLSKQDLTKAMALSLPTVSQNLDELLRQGLISEAGSFQSTGGRKARAYSCNPGACFAIGLDITRNHVGIVLIDMGRNLILQQRIRCPFENNEQYFQALGGHVARAVAQSGVDPAKICGAGIAVPGILSENRQTVAFSAVLAFTGGKCGSFARFIPYPCLLSNDANAAGFAELWGSENVNNVVYLSLSNSVGGSILIDNKIYQGENQRSGEFGHMTIVPGGRRCYCGKTGCVDAYCNAHILADSAGGNVQDFFRLLREGSKRHEALFEEYLDRLALTVNNLRMLFDCGVIIGGYVGSFMEDYIGRLRERVAALNTFEPDGLYLKACSYKSEAIAVGAALMQIERFIEAV